MAWPLGYTVLPYLDTNPSDTRDTRPWGVSDDGLVIVGGAYTTDTKQHAVYWTQSGIVDLGLLDPSGGFSVAYSTTSDGSIIVGQAEMPTQRMWRFAGHLAAAWSISEPSLAG